MAGMPGPRSIARRPGAAGLAAAAVLAVLSLLAGCTSSGSPGASPGTQLTAALARWASFPVGAQIRPVVVNADQNVTDPGFAAETDEDAFNAGAITLPPSLPSGPARIGSYRLISAARAATILTSRHGPGRTPASRLTVTRVHLGTQIYGTDRGRQALPAWQFSLQGVRGTADVLAVAAGQRYWPSGLKEADTPISASQPGRSGLALALTTIGAPVGTGPCQATYSVRQRSSAQAVAVDVIAKEDDQGNACGSSGVRITLRVTLPAPLGNRVLVDAQTSAPIPVTQPLVSSS